MSSDPVRQPAETFSIRVQDRGGSVRMLSGIAELGRQVPDRDHAPDGRGIDGGISMRCAATASVSHQGMTSPGKPFPFVGDSRAEAIGPFGALVAGRPRARATSGPSACERLLLADASFILATQFSSRRLSGASPGSSPVRRGSFFKSLDGRSSSRDSGAAAPRSWRSRAPSTRARPVSSSEMANVSKRSPRQVLAPPCARRHRAGGTGHRPQQAPPVRGGDRR